MDFTKFKALLDEQVNWPSSYTFKFVVKTEKKTELLSMLEDHSIHEKVSKKGSYTSVSSTTVVSSSEEVVAVYKKVSKIEGILSL